MIDPTYAGGEADRALWLWNSFHGQTLSGGFVGSFFSTAKSGLGRELRSCRARQRSAASRSLVRWVGDP